MSSAIRHHIFVRPARPGEGAQFLEWAEQTPGNLFDADVVTYPSTFVLAAYDKRGPLAYVPVQQPLFLEALAIKPGADALEVAQALKALTQAAVTVAHMRGVGEIYFLCQDEATIEFARRQVYEEVPSKLFRIKLRNLE